MREKVRRDMNKKEQLLRFLILETTYSVGDIELARIRFLAICKALNIKNEGRSGQRYFKWLNGIFDNYSDFNDVKIEFAKHILGINAMSERVAKKRNIIKRDIKLTKRQFTRKINEAIREELNKLKD